MIYRLLLLLATACSAAAQPASQAGSANPFAEHALVAGQRQWREGEVVERLRAGPYVYLRMREVSGRCEWYASLAATTPADRLVRLWVLGRAERFPSRRLGREFRPLSFAAVLSAPTSLRVSPEPEHAP